jgi:hypothetical protein
LERARKAQMQLRRVAAHSKQRGWDHTRSCARMGSPQKWHKGIHDAVQDVLSIFSNCSRTRPAFVCPRPHVKCKDVQCDVRCSPISVMVILAVNVQPCLVDSSIILRASVDC